MLPYSSKCCIWGMCPFSNCTGVQSQQDFVITQLIVPAYYKGVFVFAICLSYSSTLSIMFLLACPPLVPYQFFQTIICHFNTLHHAHIGLIFSCLCSFSCFYLDSSQPVLLLLIQLPLTENVSC